jgi:hypothetical protein
MADIGGGSRGRHEIAGYDLEKKNWKHMDI